MQAVFDKTDKIDQLRSRVGGEVGDTEELFLSMRGAKEDHERKKILANKTADEVEAEKERVVRELIAIAVKCQRSDGSDHDCSTKNADASTENP